jgi:glycosyltransferase involved in cell wall biosynthesis
MEIVVADGGSNDGTLQIVKRYNVNLIRVPKEKQNAEYNKGIAARAAKNEILIFIDHDNILPHKEWLKNMVTPLVEDKEIFGTGVLRFYYDKSMTLLDRYFALIGGTDPIAVFFNKSAHQSWLYQDFHLRGTVVKRLKGYYIVKFDPDKLPALGGNGAALRRSLLKEVLSNEEFFFHIDIHVDLVRKGFTKYAFVKDSVKHLTNNKLVPFLKRRKYYVEKYHFMEQSRRRYSIYEPEKDKIALFMYILYSTTIVGPFLFALRGYGKIRDKAWFIHPLMCFSMLFVYGVSTIKEEFKRVFLAK